MQVDKYCQKLIVDHEIGFACPGIFNDPFDSKVHLSWDKTKSRDKNYINKCLDLANPPLSENERNFQMEKMLQSEDELEKYVLRVQSYFRKGINDYGMLCFSEEPNNILLWSYYAAKHQGICVRFSYPGELFDASLYQVDYLPDVPFIDLVASGDAYLKAYGKVLKTKAEQWGHEAEWRVIVPAVPMQNFGMGALNNGHYPYVFSENPIDRIILGSQMSPTHRQNICDWVGQQEIEVVQAAEVEGKFQIQIPE